MEERESNNGESSEIHDENPVEESDGGTKDDSSIPSSNSVNNINGSGNRTFTMRELLNELKNEEAGAVKEAISEIPGGDQEALRASTAASDGSRRDDGSLFRYAVAIEKNPNDHDAYYNWALVLQESADIVTPDSTDPSKDSLLEEACKKYEQATRLCPTLHDAFYNWAIAISDRAKIRGRTLEAEELWKQVNVV